MPRMLTSMTGVSTPCGNKATSSPGSIVSSISGRRTHLPETPDEPSRKTYYDLELHLARDFVYYFSESIDPFVEVACECGRGLEYHKVDDDEDLSRPRVYGE